MDRIEHLKLTWFWAKEFFRELRRYVGWKILGKAEMKAIEERAKKIIKKEVRKKVVAALKKKQTTKKRKK